MSKIKALITELRPNIVWDVVKLILFWLGGAVMSTSIIAAFLVFFAGTWLNWIIIIGLFLLSLLLICIAFLVGQSNKNNVNLPKLSDEPLISIRNQVFANEKVQLDGFNYTDCKFFNVQLVYNGTARSEFSHNNLSGIIFSSDNDAVLITCALLKGLGFIKPEIPNIDRNHKPLKNVRPPKIISSDEEKKDDDNKNAD